MRNFELLERAETHLPARDRSPKPIYRERPSTSRSSLTWRPSFAHYRLAAAAAHQSCRVQSSFRDPKSGEREKQRSTRHRSARRDERARGRVTTHRINQRHAPRSSGTPEHHRHRSHEMTLQATPRIASSSYQRVDADSADKPSILTSAGAHRTHDGGASLRLAGGQGSANARLSLDANGCRGAPNCRCRSHTHDCQRRSSLAASGRRGAPNARHERGPPGLGRWHASCERGLRAHSSSG
jgi:hypothetical protein